MTGQPWHASTLWYCSLLTATEVRNGRDQLPAYQHAIVNDYKVLKWYSVTCYNGLNSLFYDHLLMTDVFVENASFRDGLEVRSYNYKRLVLAYGSNKSFTVSIYILLF